MLSDPMNRVEMVPQSSDIVPKTDGTVTWTFAKTYAVPPFVVPQEGLASDDRPVKISVVSVTTTIATLKANKICTVSVLVLGVGVDALTALAAHTFLAQATPRS